MLSEGNGQFDGRLQQIIASLHQERAAIESAIKAIEGYERIRKQRPASAESLRKLIRSCQQHGA